MVDLDSGQGHSDFVTGVVASYFEDCKRARTPAWAERCYLWMNTNLMVAHSGLIGKPVKIRYGPAAVIEDESR